MAGMSGRRRTVLAGLVTIGLIALYGALGCDTAAARRRALAAENPFDRAHGVVRASEGRDMGAVHKLVDLLEDPDSAVRMYAILALQRLCGQNYGYHYYESEPDRAAAVERWRAALRSGEPVLRAGTPTAAGPATTAPADVGSASTLPADAGTATPAPAVAGPATTAPAELGLGSSGTAAGTTTTEKRSP